MYLIILALPTSTLKASAADHWSKVIWIFLYYLENRKYADDTLVVLFANLQLFHNIYKIYMCYQLVSGVRCAFYCKLGFSKNRDNLRKINRSKQFFFESPTSSVRRFRFIFFFMLNMFKSRTVSGELRDREVYFYGQKGHFHFQVNHHHYGPDLRRIHQRIENSIVSLVFFLIPH